MVSIKVFPNSFNRILPKRKKIQNSQLILFVNDFGSFQTFICCLKISITWAKNMKLYCENRKYFKKLIHTKGRKLKIQRINFCMIHIKERFQCILTNDHVSKATKNNIKELKVYLKGWYQAVFKVCLEGRSSFFTTRRFKQLDGYADFTKYLGLFKLLCST